MPELFDKNSKLKLSQIVQDDEHLSTCKNYFYKIYNKINNKLYIVISKIYLSLSRFHPSMAQSCESLEPFHVAGDGLYKQIGNAIEGDSLQFLPTGKFNGEMRAIRVQKIKHWKNIYCRKSQISKNYEFTDKLRCGLISVNEYAELKASFASTPFLKPEQ